MKKVSLVSLLYILVSVLLGSMFVVADMGATMKAIPEIGGAPLTVVFSVESSDEVSSYSWDFNDDGVIDSTEAAPTYIFNTLGANVVKATILSGADTVPLSKTITVRDFSIIATATPQTGNIPLAVQFAAMVDGGQGSSYAWDFTTDGKVDSVSPTANFIYDTAGDYKATVTVTDSEGRNWNKEIMITALAEEVNLTIVSFFPKALKQGEQDITFVIKNEGLKKLSNLRGKLVGEGIQYLSSSSIDELVPGDEDSLTVKSNLQQNGVLKANLKIAGKSFPVELNIAGTVQYNKEELQQQLALLKGKLDEQEKIYTEKKANGYLVAEVYDIIKTSKEQLRKAQEQLLTDKLGEAKVSLDLASSSVDDLTGSLTLAQQEETTFLMWMKENAVAITAIIAALGTLSGILIKATHHAKKIGQDVKQKISEKMASGKKETANTGAVTEEKRADDAASTNEEALEESVSEVKEKPVESKKKVKK